MHAMPDGHRPECTHARLFCSLWPCSVPTAGSGQGILGNAAADLKHGTLDVFWVWTSPARLETRDLAGLGVVLGGAGTAMLVDEPVRDWALEHSRTAAVQSFGWFREGQPLERLGDARLLTRAAAAVWVGGVLAGSETVRDAGMGCLAAGVAQTFARREVVYRAVARKRPDYTDSAFEFSIPGSTDWERRSFFGGHAANAMTCVSFLAHRYHLGPLEPVLYTAAMGTGFARVLDRAHWTSDTFLGLAFGYAIGRAVAVRSLHRARASDEPETHPDEPETPSRAGRPAPAPALVALRVAEAGRRHRTGSALVRRGSGRRFRPLEL